MATPALADYFEAVARASGDGKAAYNWVMGEVTATLRATGGDLSLFRVRPADLAQLLNLVRDGTVSHTAAKRVFAVMVETGKPAAGFDEFVERSSLNNLPLVKDENARGLAHRRQAVRDNKSRTPLHNLVECAHNLCLGVGIESTRCLIENEDWRILQKRACNRQALALASRE